MVLGTEKVNVVKSLWTGAVALGGHNPRELTELVTGPPSLVPINLQKESPTRHSTDLVSLGRLSGTKSRGKKG